MVITLASGLSETGGATAVWPLPPDGALNPEKSPALGPDVLPLPDSSPVRYGLGDFLLLLEERRDGRGCGEPTVSLDEEVNSLAALFDPRRALMGDAAIFSIVSSENLEGLSVPA